MPVPSGARVPWSLLCPSSKVNLDIRRLSSLRYKGFAVTDAIGGGRLTAWSRDRVFCIDPVPHLMKAPRSRRRTAPIRPMTSIYMVATNRGSAAGGEMRARYGSVAAGVGEDLSEHIRRVTRLGVVTSELLTDSATVRPMSRWACQNVAILRLHQAATRPTRSGRTIASSVDPR